MAVASCDNATALQPGQQSKTLSQEKKKKNSECWKHEKLGMQEKMSLLTVDNKCKIIPDSSEELQEASLPASWAQSVLCQKEGPRGERRERARPGRTAECNRRNKRGKMQVLG